MSPYRRIPPSLKNVTGAAGFTAVHHAVYMITGQAWADVNQDGWLDLYLTDSGGPNSMYLNNGNGTFSLAPYTGSMALWLERSGGAVFADYDNDGWPDLYVLNWGANVLFRNNQGESFSDVTAAAGVGDSGAGKSAAWGDYDKDASSTSTSPTGAAPPNVVARLKATPTDSITTMATAHLAMSPNC